jgi:hypothetical protein
MRFPGALVRGRPFARGAHMARINKINNRFLQNSSTFLLRPRLTSAGGARHVVVRRLTVSHMPAFAAAIWSASERSTGRSATVVGAAIAIGGLGTISMTTTTTTTMLFGAGMD